ncbi:HNH endonuclease [Hyphomonas sp.]|uniref:HNH endonuclease n=1 Tax=Hyphomonas sp. TaxID=87 RepID=UPI003D2D7F89
MAKGIFVHRADSIYDDAPEERYQFPKRYLNRAKHFEGDWIAYYEPRGGGGRMGYNAIAQVAEIITDPSAEGMYLALIEPGTYMPLETFVPYHSELGFLESDLQQTDGRLNGGLIQWAIRPISELDFNRILARGLAPENLLPRVDDPEAKGSVGFEDVPAPFEFDFDRDRIETITNRLVRNRVFRRIVLDAYDRRCAFTGLQLINGGGRAEVEAAHIKGVAEKGPDIITNGIALSGTVHWMFDRGLLSLSDEYEILVSRQINNRDQIENLIHPSRKAIVPENPNHRPHPKYLEWHRKRFKN